MHIVTKIAIILNLVFCLVLSQYVWISLSRNAVWREQYEIERDARHRDKHTLEQAYNKLLAVRAANQQRTSQNTAELAALNATKQALEAWRVEAQLVSEDARRAADDLTAATQPFDRIANDYNQDVVVRLQDTLADLTTRKNRVYGERGEALRDVGRDFNRYAELHESYRRLEYHNFLLQEELERRLDTKARYRWLRPDIQRELGDNGPVIFAQVGWVQGNALQLNRGRRDGVELYQKYTIMRDGTTIAVVNVVAVQNETCECVIEDLVNPTVRPQRGDDAVTRLFMSRLSR